MFTTRDLQDWNKLPEWVRDLARRYFLAFPDALGQHKEDMAPAPPEFQGTMEKVDGVTVVEKRSSRR